MNQITIWHNPRCSKSRAGLALLEEQGIEPGVIKDEKAVIGRPLENIMTLVR